MPTRGVTSSSTQEVTSKVTGLRSEISGFNPAGLIGVGDTGFVYNKVRIGRLFQDAAGTIPADSNNDLVGLILDDGPDGKNAVQSSAGARGQLQTGDVNVIYFVTDDWLDTTFTAPSAGSLFLTFTPYSTNAHFLSAFAGGIGCGLALNSGGRLIAFIGGTVTANTGPVITSVRTLGSVRWASGSYELWVGSSQIVAGSYTGSFPALSLALGASKTTATTAFGFGEMDFEFAFGVDRFISDDELLKLIQHNV